MSGIRKQLTQEREAKILEAMMDGEWLTPTQIGMRIGFDKDNSSGRVSDAIKRLVKRGVVEMSLARGYRLKKNVSKVKEISLPCSNEQQILGPT